VVKNDDRAYANVGIFILANNGLIHLLNNNTYQVSIQEIESLSHPGQGMKMGVRRGGETGLTPLEIETKVVCTRHASYAVFGSMRLIS